MDTFKTTAKIAKGGVLTLNNLPFADEELDMPDSGIKF